MSTDISEKGFETLIMQHMTGRDGIAADGPRRPDAIARRHRNGWLAGNPKDYDRDVRDRCAAAFRLSAQRPSRKTFKKLGIVDYKDAKDIARLKFLARCRPRLASAA